jgi:cystinosin
MRTKSTVGLSVDFAIGNSLSLLCYAVYTLCMRYSETVREQYRAHHHGKNNLIAINDVVFAVHAYAMSLVLVMQISFFRLRMQRPSGTAIVIVGIATAAVAGSAALVRSGTIAAYTYVTVMSYMKIVLTVAKYVPQVLFNWARRSTLGWSIGNVLLDSAGGVMSGGEAGPRSCYHYV